MEQKNRKNEIELRSEKVRNIVGKTPPLLLRVGISISCIAILLLIGIAWIIPYKQQQDIEIEWQIYPPMQITTFNSCGHFCYDDKKEKVKQGDYIGHLLAETDTLTSLFSYTAGQIIYNLPNGHPYNRGEILFTVIPEEIHYFYGITYIPATEISNITINQKVIADFPFTNKKIKGYVANISFAPSPHPTKGILSHRIEITFPDISPDTPPTISSMASRGKVITYESSILERFFPISPKQ